MTDLSRLDTTNHKPLDGIEHRMIVLCGRLRFNHVLETMSDQAPQIQKVVAETTAGLDSKLEALDGGGWRVKSHSLTIHNGLIIITFLVER